MISFFLTKNKLYNIFYTGSDIMKKYIGKVIMYTNSITPRI